MKIKKILATSLMITFISIISVSTIACSFRKQINVKTKEFIVYNLDMEASKSIGELQKLEKNKLNTYFNISSSDIVFEKSLSYSSEGLNEIETMADKVTIGQNFRFIYTSQLKIQYTLDVLIWPKNETLPIDKNNHAIDTNDSSWTQGLQTVSVVLERNKYNAIEALNFAISEYILYYQWHSNLDFPFDQKLFEIQTLRNGDFYGSNQVDKYNDGTFQLVTKTPYFLALKAFASDGSGSFFDKWIQAGGAANNNICIKIIYQDELENSNGNGDII